MCATLRPAASHATGAALHRCRASGRRFPGNSGSTCGSISVHDARVRSEAVTVISGTAPAVGSSSVWRRLITGSGCGRSGRYGGRGRRRPRQSAQVRVRLAGLTPGIAIAWRRMRHRRHHRSEFGTGPTFAWHAPLSDRAEHAFQCAGAARKGKLLGIAGHGLDFAKRTSARRRARARESGDRHEAGRRRDAGCRKLRRTASSPGTVEADPGLQRRRSRASSRYRLYSVGATSMSPIPDRRWRKETTSAEAAGLLDRFLDRASSSGGNAERAGLPWQALRTMAATGRFLLGGRGPGRHRFRRKPPPPQQLQLPLALRGATGAAGLCPRQRRVPGSGVASSLASMTPGTVLETFTQREKLAARQHAVKPAVRRYRLAPVQHSR